jgi:hypothetical protein
LLVAIVLVAAACGKVRDEPRSTGAPDSGRPKGQGVGMDEAPAPLPVFPPDGGNGPGAPIGGADAAWAELCPDSSALRRIPGRIPCSWAFPEVPGRVVSPDKVNVQYEDNVGPRYLLTFPIVPSASDCGAHAAWYYDAPDEPTLIVGCPALCEFAGPEDAGLPGQFAAVFGCGGPLPVK